MKKILDFNFFDKNPKVKGVSSENYLLSIETLGTLIVKQIGKGQMIDAKANIKYLNDTYQRHVVKFGEDDIKPVYDNVVIRVKMALKEAGYPASADFI